jgi:1,3-beta-glucan synthase component
LSCKGQISTEVVTCGTGLCCRAFHISEDVFAGYNHTLRGAQTKFLEYISVGKGRDMGFDSINSFESKVPIGPQITALPHVPHPTCSCPCLV